jgi:hypothetical protein
MYSGMTSDSVVTTTINVSESRSAENTVELLVPSGTFDNLQISATQVNLIPTAFLSRPEACEKRFWGRRALRRAGGFHGRYFGC